MSPGQWQEGARTNFRRFAICVRSISHSYPSDGTVPLRMHHAAQDEPVMAYIRESSICPCGTCHGREHERARRVLLLVTIDWWVRQVIDSLGANTETKGHGM